MKLRSSNFRVCSRVCEGAGDQANVSRAFTGAATVQVRVRAFTLIELLVVIAIIGILASVGIPAIKGMSKTNGIAAADRQLLDDLAYARQRAMADHTPVYVVFIPPSVINFTPTDPGVNRSVTNLYGNQ